MKNLVAKLLGFISAREWPNSYELLIKKVLKCLTEVQGNSEEIDFYLRIMIQILRECDDRIAQMTSELLPVIIDVFKNSTVRESNIEKPKKQRKMPENNHAYPE